MASYNKIMLMGNLTRDVQLSYTPSQTSISDFGLAVNRKWTGKDGEKKEDVCFVDCRAFGKQADTINRYLTKGDPVFIEGRLAFESWTAKDGTKKSRHRIIVERFQFLGSREQNKTQASMGGQQNADWVGENPPPPADDSDIPF